MPSIHYSFPFFLKSLLLYAIHFPSCKGYSSGQTWCGPCPHAVYIYLSSTVQSGDCPHGVTRPSVLCFMGVRWKSWEQGNLLFGQPSAVEASGVLLCTWAVFLCLHQSSPLLGILSIDETGSALQPKTDTKLLWRPLVPITLPSPAGTLPASGAPDSKVFKSRDVYSN